MYRLLVDSSAPIRHAAAELVAGMLEEQGERFIAQVGPRNCLTKPCLLDTLEQMGLLGGLVGRSHQDSPIWKSFVAACSCWLVAPERSLVC